MGSFFGVALLALSAVTTFAQELESGLKIDVTESVVCERKSQRGDSIQVHYKGTLEDGTVFDSSYGRKQPFAFQLGRGMVITGWDRGLLDMCIGESRRLTIPSDLAYGNSAVGPIPAGSTLIFETRLMGIEGVAAETSKPSQAEDIDHTEDTASFHDRPIQEVDHTASSATNGTKGGDTSDNNTGECRLLGPFALIVQAGLGLLAVMSLVFKRWRERPRRPFKVWMFDASKQVFGSALLHVLNLFMSIISSGPEELAAKTQQAVAAQTGQAPNPCSFYLINIAVDTTVGIPILVLILKVLHTAAAYTPLARPVASIKSGQYGQPPKASWWLKQSLIYFIGLTLMKLCVYFIFQLLPWIVSVGNWALRWTEGSEALQIAFVMFVFPLIMNALQYYIVDSFIKDQSGGDHEAVPSEDEEDDEDDSRQPFVASGQYDDGDSLIGRSEDAKPVGVKTRELAHTTSVSPSGGLKDEDDEAGSRHIRS